MTYVIGESCVDVLDRACVDCGACEPVCPVEAIHYQDDLPGKWPGYAGETVRFFAEPLPSRDQPLGSPGGAARLGPVGIDTPFVAGLPQQ